MRQQIIHTNHSICRTILLLLMLWAVAIPWAAAVPPWDLFPQPYPTIPSPFGSVSDPEMLNAMAPLETTVPFPSVAAGGDYASSIPWPLKPTNAWPPRYPSTVVVDDDPTRWVACLNTRNAARLSRLFEVAGGLSNVMELPGTSDPCSQLNPEPVGWTPGWNSPDPRPAYIIREDHVLITIPDWGGLR